MMKKPPHMSNETQNSNSKDLVTPFFNEKQSPVQRPSEFNKPELETSDGSIIETRCVP